MKARITRSFVGSISLANAPELAVALGKISASLIDATTCEYTLTEKPSDPRDVSVLVNGSSSKESPVDLEFRAVQAL